MTIRKAATISAIVLSATLSHSLAAGEESSLEQAISDLQNELDNLKVDTVVTFRDGATVPDTLVSEYSNVVATARTCSIRYHDRITRNGKVVTDKDSELYLGNLRTLDAIYEARLNVPAQGSRPGLDIRYAPPRFHLRAWGSASFNFHFADATAADRVRSKFARAAELCVKLGPTPPPLPRELVFASTNTTPPGPGKGFPYLASFYPPEALALREEGAATVRFCVDVNGQLTDVPSIDISSGNPKLDAAAIEFAKAGSGHYVPASRDGVRIPACSLFRVRFQLH
jgi:TonB family protein